MSPKRIIMIGTMAVAITFGGSIWNKEANAEAMVPTPEPSCGAFGSEFTAAGQPSDLEESDTVLQLLGLTTNEQMVDAIYNGQSLSDIAADHKKDVQPLIELQIAQLTAQLDDRLAAGQITSEIYEAQKLELPEIIVKSAYGLQTHT